MPSRPPRLLTQPRLLTCILINQLATPGLGSLLARRTVSGACQLCLALAGFGLMVAWMVQFFYGMTLRGLDLPVSGHSPDWLWQWGLMLFAASWLWALVTSSCLLGQALRAERTGPTPIPPRITEPPSSKPDASG